MLSIQSNPTNQSADASSAEVFAGGDIGAEMAALAVENGDSERSAAHTQRSLAEAAQERANEAEVQAMHDEASTLRTQGIFDAAVGVASAAVLIALPPAGAMQRPHVAQLVASKGVDSGGMLGDGFFKAAEHNREADAAQQKAAADREANAAKDATDLASNANANINSALDFARTYTSIEAQTQSAALHRA